MYFITIFFTDEYLVPPTTWIVLTCWTCFETPPNLACNCTKWTALTIAPVRMAPFPYVAFSAHDGRRAFGREPPTSSRDWQLGATTN